MAVTLIRASDGIGLIQNSDDARMMRYAVNDRDGIVKGFGNELAVKFEGNSCIIQNGEFVINGWQVAISGIGESIPMQINGTYFYKIYIEIDLRVLDNQTAAVKAMYSLTDINPTIDDGDDLTANPTGVARRLLHYIKVVNGKGQVLKSADKLEYDYASVPYVDAQIRAVKNIEYDNVIFGGNVVGNIRRQVNFVHLYIDMPVVTKNTTSALGQYGMSGLYYMKFIHRANLSTSIIQKYCPKVKMQIGGRLFGSGNSIIEGGEAFVDEELSTGTVNGFINVDGSIEITVYYDFTMMAGRDSVTNYTGFRAIINAGYEITGGAND